MYRGQWRIMAKMRRFTSREIKELFDCWPMKLPKCRWVLDYRMAGQLAEYKCIWKFADGKRYTMKKALKAMEDSKDFVGARHMVRSLARGMVKPKCVILYGKYILDGTHRVMAMMLNKYKGKILVAIAVKNKGGKKC